MTFAIFSVAPVLRSVGSTRAGGLTASGLLGIPSFRTETFRLNVSFFGMAGAETTSPRESSNLSLSADFFVESLLRTCGPLVWPTESQFRTTISFPKSGAKVSSNGRSVTFHCMRFTLRRSG